MRMMHVNLTMLLLQRLLLLRQRLRQQLRIAKGEAPPTVQVCQRLQLRTGVRANSH